MWLARAFRFVAPPIVSRVYNPTGVVDPRASGLRLTRSTFRPPVHGIYPPSMTLHFTMILSFLTAPQQTGLLDTPGYV